MRKMKIFMKKMIQIEENQRSQDSPKKTYIKSLLKLSQEKEERIQSSKLILTKSCRSS